MLSIEAMRLIFRNKIYIPLTKKRRGNKLKNKDFTIISNNCWGGTVYEAYDLPKKTPTAGLFFMAQDYIRFLSDLKGYINGTLTFIDPKDSKWNGCSQISSDSRYGTYPIGLLSNGKDSVEVFFLHYHSENEAEEKWKRRCQRINYDKLLIKFNDQNGCTEKELKEFISLPYKNKIFFTCKKWSVKSDDIVYISQPFHKDHIQASYEPFENSRHADIGRMINEL